MPLPRPRPLPPCRCPPHMPARRRCTRDAPPLQAAHTPPCGRAHRPKLAAPPSHTVWWHVLPASPQCRAAAYAQRNDAQHCAQRARGCLRRTPPPPAVCASTKVLQDDTISVSNVYYARRSSQHNYIYILYRETSLACGLKCRHTLAHICRIASTTASSEVSRDLVCRRTMCSKAHSSNQIGRSCEAQRHN